MASWVTRKGRGRLYVIEDNSDQFYVTNEPFIELLLEAKLNMVQLSTDVA